MPVRFASLSIFVLTLFRAAPLRAQDLAQVCSAATRVAVGQWASYRFTSGGDQGGTMRMALVGAERHHDSTFYWLEVAHAPPGDSAHDGVVQLLMSDFGSPGVVVHGVILKKGADPAMRLPDEMVALLSAQFGQNNPAIDLARSCVGALPVGWEQVSAPVGTIRALHVKGAEGGEAWLAPEVPFELVKLRTPKGMEMVLTGRGKDARSSIVETPQVMPGALSPP